MVFKAIHKDESAPNTVEWVLLITVALIVLSGIYYIVKWTMGEAQASKTQTDTAQTEAMDQLESIKSWSSGE